MAAMRSNAHPHSPKLHPHLIIQAPSGAEWAAISKLVLKKMPWRELPSEEESLHHLAPQGRFPFKCTRCSYCCNSQVRL